MKSTADRTPDGVLETRTRYAFVRSTVWAGASLVLGLAVGVLLHYLIYRLSLPTEPFIYVGF